MKSNRIGIALIGATLFLDALGIGLLVPVFPDVLRRIDASPDFVNRNLGLFLSVHSLMQLIASPALGSLSDRYGRRPVLLLSLLGACFSYLLMGTAPSLLWLFLGRAISGLTEANVTVASSYIADVSAPSERAANLGLVGAAFGVGFILGPAIGGALGRFGVIVPCLLALALNLANAGLCFFFLPESLPSSSRRKVVLAELSPIRSLVRIARPSPLRRLFLIHLLFSLGTQVYSSIWSVYTQYRFAWSPAAVGASISTIGVLVAFAQGYLVRIFTARWGERSALFIGGCFGLAGFLGFALATHGWMLYVLLVAACPAAVVEPAMRSLISRGAPASLQGEVQGTAISLGNLATILGAPLYARLFAWASTGSAAPASAGAPFLAAALFAVGALLLLPGLRSSSEAERNADGDERGAAASRPRS